MLPLRIAIVVWLLFPFCSIAQSKFRGKVITDGTRTPLAFANVIIINSTNGTSTDIDGRFTINVEVFPITLQISSIGFETRTIIITSPNSELIIKLKEKSTELRELVIRPDDNPAFRIIRKATASKPEHDPDNLTSFRYNSYNKIYSTLLNRDTLPDAVRDTAKLNQYLKDHHLFVHESYTARTYLRPNHSKEIILGNHLSGVKDPFFAFLATDLQPFSFYKDYIALFGKDYISPLSPESTNRYDFILRDTIYQQQDSIYVISFEPLPGKVFDGLRGDLFITTNGYAIQSVRAQPADPNVLIESIIEQQYKKTDGHWFPDQLNATLRFKQFAIQNLKLQYVSHSYITNVSINDASITPPNFSVANVEFETGANRRDSSFWNLYRTGDFSQREKGTFHTLDSVGEKLPLFQAAFKAIEGFFVGRFRVGKFYVPIDPLVRFNNYENVRVGFGIQTGESISKIFSLDGYVGYGMRDHALKYGGGVTINLSMKHDVNFRAAYTQDIEEPGGPSFLRASVAVESTSTIRRWMTSRMDTVRQVKFSLTQRPFRGAQVSLFVCHEGRNPTYTYRYVSEKLAFASFRVSDIGLQWRLAPNEKYIKIGTSEVITAFSYPQINVAVSRAFKDLWGGQFGFTKAQLRIDHQFKIRGLGKTTLQLAGGIVDGDVPYPYLFNCSGSKYDHSSLNYFMVNNYFQTMALYEFASDRYLNLFINHSVGRITSDGSKYFRPELLLIQNSGIGNIRNLLAHEGITFGSLKKGYLESGLMLNNLVRFNYFNLLYVGVGMGGFYRYGPYAFTKYSNNLALKFSINLSF